MLGGMAGNFLKAAAISAQRAEEAVSLTKKQIEVTMFAAGCRDLKSLSQVELLAALGAGAGSRLSMPSAAKTVALGLVIGITGTALLLMAAYFSMSAANAILDESHADRDQHNADDDASERDAVHCAHLYTDPHFHFTARTHARRYSYADEHA